MHVGQLAIEPVVRPSQTLEVESQDVQRGRVELPDIGHSFDAAAAEFVSGAIAHTPLYASAHHPHGERIWIVIAAGSIHLMGRHAAKLGGPQYQRVIQQSALLE